MKTKLILAAGMMRSGSTWQYNVIRLSLQEAGFKVYACWIEDYDEKKAEGMDYAIVKVHEWNKALADKADMIFTTIRDAKGIEKSCKRVGIKGKVVDMYKNHSKWFSVADHITSYQQMEVFPMVAVESIMYDIFYKEGVFMEGMDFSIKSSNVDSMVSRLTQPNHGDFDSGYDPVTLLHPQHISNE